MKQIKHIAIIAAAAALSVACAKEMEAPEEHSVSQITATWAESRTKTVLGEDGTSVLWSPNDEISVFYNTVGVKFTSLNTAPVDQTIFASDKALIFGGTEGYIKDYLYGIYPYSSDNFQDGEYLTLTVPAVQTAVEGSFCRGTFPSIGRSEDTNIAFYNVCGGIRFSVTNSGVNRIVFSGMNREDLAGKVKTVFDLEEKPAITSILEGDKKLVLYNETEFTPGKYYYISAIPAVLANGFKMVFYTATKHATLTTTSSVEIKRSIFGSLKDADAGLIYEDCDYVDLGLSVLWANCNLGATRPEEYGTYFAWADVTGQTWNGSEWSGGGFSSDANYELDENGNLKPEYDAAHVNSGNNWRMPTKTEQQELIDNCTSTWTNNYNDTGVAGIIFTSNKNGKSIFLPAGGTGITGKVYNAGDLGHYWSSTFRDDSHGWSFSFSSSGLGTDYPFRYIGQLVRPVTE